MATAFATRIFTKLHALWVAENLPLTERLRVQRVLILGCSMLLLLCVVWSIFFAVHSQWLAMSATLLLLGCAGGSFLLIARVHPGWLEAMLFVAVMLLISGMSLVLDAPTAQSARTLHLFLLPLAVAAFMTFREARGWLSVTLAAFCLGLFLVLSASPWQPFPALNLPEALRGIAKWMNSGASLALMLLLLHVLNSDAKQYSDMDRQLKTALEAQQFVLYYQPQLDQQQRVTGAEVLVRWQHPQRGLLPPGVFIDHAERNGLMVPLGQWILEQACAQLRKWKEDPVLAQLELAVNVSQTQFRQESFAADVLAAVNRHYIDPQRLELELTETLMVLNMEELQHKMKLLVDSGLRFSLDDFGTGFSSLSLLRQLPLHTLKIDRSFVMDLPHDSSSTTIVKTLLGLAQNMDLIVVAEGIEVPEQHAFLQAHGCPRYQGYLYSKPLPLQDFVAFVQRHNSAEPAARNASQSVESTVA